MKCLISALLLVLIVVPLANGGEALPTLTPTEKARLDEAEKLNGRSLQLDAQGRTSEAIPLAKKALMIRTELLGRKHPHTATSLNNMGFLLDSMGHYAAAQPYYKQALAIYKEVLGEKHPHTVTSLNNLGVLLYSMGDYAAARPYLEQALAINKEVLGEKHDHTVGTLNNLGTLLKNSGDYTAARRYLEKALAIKREVYGEKHPKTALSVGSLGQLLEAMGDYDTARTYLEKALAINKEVLGEKHRDTARSLNNLGSLLSNVGDYAAALACYERALAIHKEVSGEHHPATATSLNNLGGLHLETGDYAAARSYYEQALAIDKMALGEEHPGYATELANLGILLTRIGQDAAARPYLEKALMIRRESLGEMHPDTAWSHSSLAGVLSAMRDFAAARVHYELALAICREVLGEKHPETAASLHGLGGLFYDMGEYAEARQYYEQALAIHKEVLGQSHPDTAMSLNNLGNSRYKMQDYAAARQCYEQALVIRKEVLGENHPYAAMSFDDLADLEAESQRWAEAAANADHARRIVRRHVARVLPSLSAREQEKFLLGNDLEPFHWALSLGLFRATDPVLVLLSYGWLLNGKAVAQEALADGTLLARQSLAPALGVTVKELLASRRQLAALTLAMPGPGQEAARRAQLKQLERQEETLSRRVAETNGQAFQSDPWVEVAAVRRALPRDALLVDIVRFHVNNVEAKGQEKEWQPAHYAAWVIPTASKDREIKIIDLGEADKIDETVQEVRTALQAAMGEQGTIRGEGEPEAEGLLRKPLEELAKLVLEPIVKHTDDAKQLIISPDAALWLVPWGALPLADGRYAIEQYQIRYVVSGRDLVTGQASQLKTHPPVIMADPDFDLSPTAAQAATRAVLRGRESAGDEELRSLGPNKSSSALPKAMRLPYTAVEAELVSPKLHAYTHEAPVLYTDKFALEGVFKALQRPQVAVLSTHGFFLEDQEAKRDDGMRMSSELRSVALTVDGKPIENPLLRCGLLLAGCNQGGESHSTDGEDGILTGMEIVGTDLRGTELVVLSACETGLGQVRNGEGVAGLRQAFQLAGAKAVVATLWQIPDRESARLMTTFFENLAAGQTKADALRNAQLKMIESRRDKYGAAHPFYWAAFTITGE